MCAVELFIRTGSIMGKAAAWRRLCHVKSHLVGRPQCAHLSTFRRNTSSRYVQLFNSCAPVLRGGWWPPKRHCTQKVKLRKNEKLSTIVNRDMLKLVSITFSKMLFLLIITSLFLPHPVYSYIKLYGGFIIYSDTSANENNSFRNHIR